MKGLMNVFLDSSAIMEEWRMIGLLKRYMWGVFGKSFGRATAEEVNDCLEKKREILILDEKYRNEWWRFVRVNASGVARGMNPRLRRNGTVVDCHS